MILKVRIPGRVHKFKWVTIRVESCTIEVHIVHPLSSTESQWGQLSTDLIHFSSPQAIVKCGYHIHITTSSYPTSAERVKRPRISAKNNLTNQ